MAAQVGQRHLAHRGNLGQGGHGAVVQKQPGGLEFLRRARHEIAGAGVPADAVAFAAQFLDQVAQPALGHADLARLRLTTGDFGAARERLRDALERFPARPERDVLRFDDTLYRMLGSNLEHLTTETEMLLDAGTYQARQLSSVRLPGALVSEMAFTL